MKWHRLSIGFVIAGAFGFLGCATERGIDPASLGKLPAMDLTITPGTAITDAIQHTKADTCDTCLWGGLVYEFAIPESVLSIATPHTDVYVSFVQDCHSTGTAFVLDQTVGKWRELQSNRYCPYERGRPLGSTSWLLSKFGPSPIDVFCSEDRRFELRTWGISRPEVRVVWYDPQYVFVTAIASYLTLPSVLAFDGGWLWVSQSEPLYLMDVDSDLLRTFDLSGSPVAQHWTCPRGCDGMTWGDGALWLRSSWARGFYKLSTDGSCEMSFATNWTPDTHRGGMAWIDGRIWMMSDQAGTLVLAAIDMGASVDSGHAVIAESHVITPSIDPRSMTWDGACLDILVDGRVNRYSLEGRLVEVLPKPSLLLSAIAWDGDAFWALHHGPVETPTDATLLSRFYPR